MPHRVGAREMQDNVEIAENYRLRAREIRAIAFGVYDPTGRKKLLEVSAEYEEWAQVARAMDKANSNQLPR
jgi:hypothetical protein